MNSFVNTLSPSITTMIRMDHSHVLTTFHQYRSGINPSAKQALVGTACLLLEVHAQLEEEIFYPAMRAALPPDNHVLDKSVPEHDEMKRLVAQLRNMAPADPAYDQAFLELMRDVMHHVADEETTLLPEAERLLADRLGELGAQMTKRRLELIAPRTGELARHSFQAVSAGSMMLAAGAFMAGSYLAKRALRRHS
jgi:hemerythrin superfamily protein